MNADPYPPPLPNHVSSSESPSLAVRWCWIGLVFALVQFGLSEAAFRMAELGGPERLYDVSNTIAWPAGHLYDRADIRLITGILEEWVEEAEDADLRAEAAALLERRGDPEFLEDARDFLVEQDIDEALNLFTEYLIYGGTCVLWGIAVGVVGFLVVSEMNEPESFRLQ